MSSKQTDDEKWMAVVKWHTPSNNTNSKTIETYAQTAEEALIQTLNEILPQLPNENHIEYAECWVHGLVDVSERHKQIDIAMRNEHLQNEGIENIVQRYS